jgi:heme a synthase
VAASGLLSRARAWQPSPTALHRAFLAALVMNTLIVVTGGAVRLTASGLGCPTVPKCTDTSMVVTREMGVHGYIEFSNRMLTFVLTAAVGWAVVTAWRARRRDLRLLSGALFLGIVVQAVLGAVTVRTGLNPVSVMAHFLLSMGLIAVAAYAHDVAGGPRTANTLVVRGEIRVGARLVAGVVAAVLFLGTVVTGTGPHSGDKNASHRLPFDLADVTHAHADLVFVLLGLTVGLLVALRATGAPEAAVRRGVVLLGVVLAQGLVGFTQYLTDLPVALVGVHVLGATLVWIATLRLLLAMTLRAEPGKRRAPASEADRSLAASRA